MLLFWQILKHLWSTLAVFKTWTINLALTMETKARSQISLKVDVQHLCAHHLSSLHFLIHVHVQHLCAHHLSSLHFLIHNFIHSSINSFKTADFLLTCFLIVWRGRCLSNSVKLRAFEVKSCQWLWTKPQKRLLKNEEFSQNIQKSRMIEYQQLWKRVATLNVYTKYWYTMI